MSNSKQLFTNARLMAIQAVYAQKQSGESFDKVISRFLLGEMGGEVISEENGSEKYITLTEADQSLFAHLTQYVRDNEKQLNEMIDGAFSDKIQPDKVDLTLRAILMVGVGEFFVNPNLDAPIIINEYTDITRSFYAGPQVKIVNAILDKMGKVLRS
jgi:N utilization substance protein B